MPVPPSHQYNMMQHNQAAWGMHQASMHTAKQVSQTKVFLSNKNTTQISVPFGLKMFAIVRLDGIDG